MSKCYLGKKKLLFLLLLLLLSLSLSLSLLLLLLLLLLLRCYVVSWLLLAQTSFQMVQQMGC